MTEILAICPHSKTYPSSANNFRHARGFSLLEMIVVIVLLGIISALAFPGLQRMYDSVGRELARNEIKSIFNSLSFSVQSSGREILFSGFPGQADELPGDIVGRLSELNVEVTISPAIYVSATGFCPSGGDVLVSNGVVDYQLTLRSPDCKVINQ